MLQRKSATWRKQWFPRANTERRAYLEKHHREPKGSSQILLNSRSLRIAVEHLQQLRAQQALGRNRRAPDKPTRRPIRSSSCT